jgi:hypothetical protein
MPPPGGGATRKSRATHAIGGRAGGPTRPARRLRRIALAALASLGVLLFGGRSATPVGPQPSKTVGDSMQREPGVLVEVAMAYSPSGKTLSEEAAADELIGGNPGL